MPHRLRAHGLVSYREAELLSPRLARAPGVRVSGVSIDDEDTLWFRAEGAVTHGIWRERTTGEAELVAKDDGAVLLEPRAVHGCLVVKRCLPAGAPSAANEIVFAREGMTGLALPGQSFAVSGEGRVGLVVDTERGALTRVDLGHLESSAVGSFPAGLDPQREPLLALDDDGGEALFSAPDDKGGGLSLFGLSLDDGQTTRLHGPLPAAAWVTGAFLPNARGVLALVCRFGDTPLTTLLWLFPDGSARELFRAEVTAPCSVPALIDERAAVLPLSFESHPLATYGPTDLIAVSLEGKAPVRLTRRGDVTGQARVRARGVVVVEGGDALVRVTPT